MSCLLFLYKILQESIIIFKMKYPYYICYNVFSMQELEQLNYDFKNNHRKDLEDRPASNVKKNAEVLIVDWKVAKKYLDRTNELVIDINKNDYCFDIFGYSDYDTCNYNTYTAEGVGQYDWHTDSTGPKDAGDIKLTVLINASTEQYKGGGFEIFRNGFEPIKEFDTPGSVLIFPGFIPHKVNPVVSGTRVSVSYWVTGPKFR